MFVIRRPALQVCRSIFLFSDGNGDLRLLFGLGCGSCLCSDFGSEGSASTAWASFARKVEKKQLGLTDLKGLSVPQLL